MSVTKPEDQIKLLSEKLATTEGALRAAQSRIGELEAHLEMATTETTGLRVKLSQAEAKAATLDGINREVGEELGQAKRTAEEAQLEADHVEGLNRRLQEEVITAIRGQLVRDTEVIEAIGAADLVRLNNLIEDFIAAARRNSTDAQNAVMAVEGLRDSNFSSFERLEPLLTRVAEALEHSQTVTSEGATHEEIPEEPHRSGFMDGLIGRSPKGGH